LIIRSSSEPPIEPEISTQLVQNKTVVIVQVKKGNKKPYTIKGKGVFVRVGATDRIATRDELIALVQEHGFG
jgi:ATP-dependent DNA helicase RecG